MDISIEAIEAELAQAQAHAGRPVATEALMRAQILATLYAAQPVVQTFTGQQGLTGPDAIPIGPPGIQVPFSPPAEDVSFTGLVDATEDDDPFADDEDEDDGLSRLGPNR